MTPNFPLSGGLSVRIAFDSDPLDDTPVWTDIGGVREIHIKGGRNHELDRMEAVTLTLVLDNGSGDFWPKNAAGDYYDNIKTDKRISVRAARDGVYYDFFTGYIESWEPGWLADGGYGAVMVLNCVDGSGIFTGPALNTSYGAELSGARVGHIADTIGWPSADRDIDTGQMTMQARTLVNVNALGELQQVQDTELGLVFISPAGILIFEDRSHRTLSPHDASVATFGPGAGELPYTDLKYVLDKTLIYNDVRVTRVGGSEQVASDTDSQTAHGKRTLTRSTINNSDAFALSVAEFLLCRHIVNEPRVEAILLKPSSSNELWPQVMARAVSDRITVKKTVASIDADYFIEGYQHDWNFITQEFSTMYQLSDAGNYLPTLAERTETFNPNANGTKQEWDTLYGASTHWQAVQMGSDAKYIANISAGNEADTFQWAGLPWSKVTVASVKVYFRTNALGDLTGNIVRAYIKIGANYYSGDDVADTYVVTTHSFTWTNSPATGNPWTFAELNSMEFGCWSNGSAIFNHRYYGASIEVKYTPQW